MSERDADWSDINGLETTRRANEVAASNQDILLVGSPGSGKTLLAYRLTTILPVNQSNAESTKGPSLTLAPPFHAPARSVTPRELENNLDLARGGLLFSDDLPKFSSQVFGLLSHQPESQDHFLLAATMALCPCSAIGSQSSSSGMASILTLQSTPIQVALQCSDSPSF